MIAAEKNIVGLCDRLRREFAGAKASKAVEFIRHAIGPDVKLVLDFEKRGAQREQNRATKFGYLDNVLLHRVMLTSARTGVESELARQCSGVVIEYPSWNILSMPPTAFARSAEFGEIVPHIDEYDIYAANDGTILTLYYYDDAWRMSSANGFDVGGFKWSGPLTYLEMFNELARELYPKFSFDALDKAKCYTVGMRHHNMHPLRADPAKLWLVRVCDLAAVNAGKCDEIYAMNVADIGIPAQRPITLPEGLSGADLKSWLVGKNLEALNEFTSSQKVTHYGYVLRARRDIGRVTSVFLPSSLMKFVSEMLYDVSKNVSGYVTGAPGNVTLSADNRTYYAILHAYMSNRRMLFINAFPQFRPHYLELDYFFRELISGVANVLQPICCTPAAAKRTCIVGAATMAQLALQVAAVVRSHVTIDVDSDDGSEILRDYVMDVSLADVYFATIVAASTGAPMANLPTKSSADAPAAVDIIASNKWPALKRREGAK